MGRLVVVLVLLVCGQALGDLPGSSPGSGIPDAVRDVVRHANPLDSLFVGTTGVDDNWMEDNWLSRKVALDVSTQLRRGGRRAVEAMCESCQDGTAAGAKDDTGDSVGDESKQQADRVMFPLMAVAWRHVTNKAADNARCFAACNRKRVAGDKLCGVAATSACQPVAAGGGFHADVPGVEAIAPGAVNVPAAEEPAVEGDPEMHRINRGDVPKALKRGAGIAPFHTWGRGETAFLQEQEDARLRRRLRGPGTLEPELDAETKRTELEKEESEPVEDVYKWVEAYRWKAPIRLHVWGWYPLGVRNCLACPVVLVCGRRVRVGGCTPQYSPAFSLGTNDSQRIRVPSERLRVAVSGTVEQVVLPPCRSHESSSFLLCSGQRSPFTLPLSRQ